MITGIPDQNAGYKVPKLCPKAGPNCFLLKGLQRTGSFDDQEPPGETQTPTVRGNLRASRWTSRHEVVAQEKWTKKTLAAARAQHISEPSMKNGK